MLVIRLRMPCPTRVSVAASWTSGTHRHTLYSGPCIRDTQASVGHWAQQLLGCANRECASGQSSLRWIAARAEGEGGSHQQAGAGGGGPVGAVAIRVVLRRRVWGRDCRGTRGGGCGVVVASRTPPRAAVGGHKLDAVVLQPVQQSCKTTAVSCMTCTLAERYRRIGPRETANTQQSRAHSNKSRKQGHRRGLQLSRFAALAGGTSIACMLCHPWGKGGVVQYVSQSTCGVANA